MVPDRQGAQRAKVIAVYWYESEFIPLPAGDGSQCGFEGADRHARPTPSALWGRDDLLEAAAGRHGGESQAGGSALRRGWPASEKAKAEEDPGVGASPARAPFGRQSGLVNAPFPR